MRKKLLCTSLLLALILLACGENNDIKGRENISDFSKKKNMNIEEETEEKIEEKTKDIPFDCKVTISDESGKDYYCVIGEMDSIEQINVYVTSAITLAEEFPRSIFSFSLKDSSEQIAVSIDDKKISIISTESDGKSYFDYPSWYKAIEEDGPADILRYVLLQATKGEWKSF